MIVLPIRMNKYFVYSYNLKRISFFKRYVKEDVVAAVFMFELTVFEIFDPRNGILFCPLFVLQGGISNATCDLLL